MRIHALTLQHQDQHFVVTSPPHLTKKVCSAYAARGMAHLLCFIDMFGGECYDYCNQVLHKLLKGDTQRKVYLFYDIACKYGKSFKVSSVWLLPMSIFLSPGTEENVRKVRLWIQQRHFYCAEHALQCPWTPLQTPFSSRQEPHCGQSRRRGLWALLGKSFKSPQLYKESVKDE